LRSRIQRTDWVRFTEVKGMNLTPMFTFDLHLGFPTPAKYVVALTNVLRFYREIFSCKKGAFFLFSNSSCGLALIYVLKCWKLKPSPLSIHF
jgi:hypothetical protein